MLQNHHPRLLRASLRQRQGQNSRRSVPNFLNLPFSFLKSELEATPPITSRRRFKEGIPPTSSLSSLVNDSRIVAPSSILHLAHRLCVVPSFQVNFLATRRVSPPVVIFSTPIKHNEPSRGLALFVVLLFTNKGLVS